MLLPLLRGVPFETRRLPVIQDLAHLPTKARCVLVTSPAHLTRLPEDGSRLRGVDLVLSAGGPLPQDAVIRCREVLGVLPTEIYGSSETGAVASRQRGIERVLPWQPTAGVEFRVEHDDLWLRTAQLPSDAWYRTGDRAPRR